MINPKTESVFFNKLLGLNAKNKSGRPCGKIADLIVALGDKQPKVIALCLKKDGIVYYIDWKSVEVIKNERVTEVIVRNINNLIDVKSLNNVLFVNKDLINRQILDVNGKKLERVNDIRFAMLQGQTRIIAVDVGFRGFLRKRGVENLISKIAKFFRISFRNRLVVWDNLHPIFGDSGKFQLTTTYDKLKTLHAADLADIIEDLGTKERTEFFQSLDLEKAADVLEEMETEVQVSILESLPEEVASDILETMPTDEAADILEELDEDTAESLLNQMDDESSGEIRELMSYTEKAIGSIMSKDFVAFLPDFTVGEAIKKIREMKPTDEEIPYVYVINSKEELLGVMSLMQLLMCNDTEKLYNIMQPNVITVTDQENVEKVNEIFTKYPFIAVPVLGEAKDLTGIVHLRDIYLEIIE